MLLEEDTGSQPYSDFVSNTDYFIRQFSDTVFDTELIWHRDKKDRKITVLSGKGWSLQMDNALPYELIEGNYYSIEKEVYHRIIKPASDCGNLVLKIQEFD